MAYLYFCAHDRVFQTETSPRVRLLRQLFHIPRFAPLTDRPPRTPGNRFHHRGRPTNEIDHDYPAGHEDRRPDPERIRQSARRRTDPVSRPIPDRIGCSSFRGRGRRLPVYTRNVRIRIRIHAGNNYITLRYNTTL